MKWTIWLLLVTSVQLTDNPPDNSKSELSNNSSNYFLIYKLIVRSDKTIQKGI